MDKQALVRKQVWTTLYDKVRTNFFQNPRMAVYSYVCLEVGGEVRTNVSERVHIIMSRATRMYVLQDTVKKEVKL